MKKVLVLTLVVLVAALAAIAADTMTGGMAVGQSRNITLVEPAMVGGVALPAGDYAVKHTMEGDNHVMVFTQVRGKATAKVNCKMVELPKKADRTTYSFSNAEQARVLTGITWKGDTVTHQF